MILSFAVFPASAVGEDVTLKITPDKTKIDTSAGDVVVEYTISVEVKDSSVEIGGIQFQLEPPSGMTLPDAYFDGDGNQLIWFNQDELVQNVMTGTGIFALAGYEPTTYRFTAGAAKSTKPLNKNIDLMTIKATISKGATGSLTLGYNTTTTPPVFSKIDGGAVKWSYTVETTPVTVVSSISGNLSVAIAKPVVNQAPVTTLTDSQYSGTITWDPAVTSGGKFAASTVYTANVTLTAKDGYQFANGVSPTVTNATISDKSVSADGKTLTFKAKFDTTGSLPPASVTNPPAAKSGLTYKGTDQELVNAGTTPDGTMQYSLNGTTWSTAIPKGKDAGDYTVYYMVKGDSDHTDYTPASNTVSVTIGPKSIADSTVTIDPIPNQVYDGGNELKTLPVVKDGATTLVKDKDYTVSYTKNTNAGTATLTIKGTGNYNGTNSKNFTIDPATQTLNVPGSTNVAFNKTRDLKTICSSNAPGATLTFALAPGASMPSGTTFDAATGIVTAGNKTGSFSVTVDSAAVTNYNAALQGRITVYIVTTPAASVAAAPTAKTDLKYNGNDQALVSKGTANGGTMQYSLNNSTWSNEIPKGKDAGNYTVYYKVKGDSDHTDFTPTSNTVSVSIAQKEVTVAPGTYKVSKEYDGTTTAGTGNGVLSVTGIVDSGVSVTATPVAYTSANVGGQSTMDVTINLVGTGNGNYKIKGGATTISVPCEITAKDVKLTGGINATDRSYVKDNKTVNLTKGALTFDGLVSGETLDVNIPATGTISDAKVGTYNVTYSGVTLKDGTGKASNYKLVSPLPTVTVNITQALTPTAPTGLTGVKGNKLVSVALPAGWSWANPTQEMTTDGSQTFTANYTDQEGNYAPGTGISVHVNVKDKTDVSTNITFPNGSLVYNGHGQEYKKATISGIIAGDTPSWTYTYAVESSTTATLNSSGLPLTVGKYKVTAIYEDSANYGTATATLEITPAKPTGTPTFTKITEKGKTLNDAALTVGTLNPTGGTLVWVDGDTTEVEANKAYEWKYTPTNPNYAPVTGTIVVYPVSTGIVIYSPCYTIKASAGANGTISPAGWCSVVENGSQTFTFTPDKGYTVAKVLVDGKSVGAVKSYTFKNVTKDHTIEVIFMKSNGNPATGVFVMP